MTRESLTKSRPAFGDQNAAGRDARLEYRRGRTGVSAGVAPGFVQGNLVILPEREASSFHRFCQLNPKPCPIIGMSDVGNPRIPALGLDLDVRSDLPKYRVWRKGELVEEPNDIKAHWRDDFVAFVIGCSFSFEEALIEDGLSIRHIEQKTNVPMYRTSIACKQAGEFSGPMVVSMRPFRPADAIRAIQITTRFPAVHGAPVHIGLPQLIGIQDMSKPDYGEPVTVQDDEIPVFWACGVTPQSIILESKPEFAITHAPGSMLVTDLRNTDFSIA